MRKLLSMTMGSVTALVGFADAARASATVDLIWIDVSATNAGGNPICLLPANRNCLPDPRSADGGVTISSVAVTDNITLGVILTAGPNGSIGGSVSVNYADALPKLSVFKFQRLATTLPLPYLPLNVGITSNQPPYIDNINAAAAPLPGVGIGLPPGVSAYLGTVTFHKDFFINGSFEISVGTDGPGGTDGLLDGVGVPITDTTTFNSAFLVNAGIPPTPSATPTPAPTPTPRCEYLWPLNFITTIGKGRSPANNLKVSHGILAHIIDPGAVCPSSGPCTAHRIPVCAGTLVTIRVTGSVRNTNVGKGVIACDASSCSVGSIDVTERYKSVSADGRDTDRITLLPQ